MAFRILIVDDSATTRAIIKRTIQMARVPTEKVLEAPNGMEALRLLATEPVDLILADLHMPEMDGVEMTRRILADEATKLIPVIIISAEPSATRLEQLKQDGARGYLRKPFTPESVRNLINQTLGVLDAAA